MVSTLLVVLGPRYRSTRRRRRIGIGAGGREQLTFVDRARIAKNEVAASMWAWRASRTHSTSATTPISIAASPHYVFNCAERTYALSEWVMYEAHWGTADRVGERVSVPIFRRFEAGHREASLLAAACGDVLANQS